MACRGGSSLLSRPRQAVGPSPAEPGCCGKQAEIGLVNGTIADDGGSSGGTRSPGPQRQPDPPRRTGAHHPGSPANVHRGWCRMAAWPRLSRSARCASRGAARRQRSRTGGCWPCGRRPDTRPGRRCASRARPRPKSSTIRTGCSSHCGAPPRRVPPTRAGSPSRWDEALDTIATKLTAVAEESGPEAVVFGSASPSTSAISDSVDWVLRLKRAFGSPNFCSYMELCGWGRFMASIYTYGEPVPGVYLPDLDNAGCILFWGYNPSVARLAHATATTAALRRGAKLIVVDPRRAGLASKAQQWLRVRPGTDGALALSMTHVMLERDWYDAEFLRDWTNAFDVIEGRVVLDLIKAECARFAPEAAARITGVPAEQIVATARLLWDARPVAFYTWSGLEQHSNATQTVRAIGQLYALTGCIDAPGGNVLFTPVPTNPIDGAELAQPAAAGQGHRRAGPPPWPSALRVHHRRGPVPGRARPRPVPGPRAGQLRCQPRHGARQQRPGARRASSNT